MESVTSNLKMPLPHTKKPFDIYKYCNCYNFNNYGRIEVECFDTVLEAVKSFEEREDKSISPAYESRLLYVNRLFPEFVNKMLIQNEFRKNVVFLSPGATRFNGWSYPIKNNYN